MLPPDESLLPWGEWAAGDKPWGDGPPPESLSAASDPSNAGLDWSSVAILVAESGGKPLAVLDGDGRIRHVSHAMEQILGWQSHELKGRRWCELCGADCASSVGLRFDEVLRGLRRAEQCEVRARGGALLRLQIHMEVAGRGAEQAVLLSVERVTPVAMAAESPAAADTDYIVTRAGPGFGRLHSVDRIGWTQSKTDDGEHRCYRALHRRDAPCPDCPWLRAATGPAPWVTIRRRAADDGFQVVSAEPLDATLGRVRVRNVSDGVLGAIHEAKVRALADKAHLSERERSVLDYLRMGRSLDEIASILGLSRRTVKFHQANILQKLGADSRFHLISLAAF